VLIVDRDAAKHGIPFVSGDGIEHASRSRGYRGTWYGSFPPKSDGAALALDALAKYVEFLDDFWINLESTDPEALETGHLSSSPTDDLEHLFPKMRIHRFGWLDDSLPTIDLSIAYPPAPKPRASLRHENSMVNMLGSILWYMEDTRKAGKTLLMPTQASLIDKLVAKHPGVSGISASNLEKWFSVARQAIKSATIADKTP
jgi:hypothetical protein